MTPDPVDWPTSDLLTHRVRSTPDRTAVIDADAGDAWTYREFDRHVDYAVAGLSAVSGDRLGVLLDTRPAFASVVFAAMRTGRTLVPLNLRETDRELASKAARTDLDAIVCEGATESRAISIAAELESIDGEAESTDVEADSGPVAVYSVDDSDRSAIESVFRIEGAASTAADSTDSTGSTASTDSTDATDSIDSTDSTASNDPFDSTDPFDVSPVALDRDDVQLILFTSGTSGAPKAVRLTVGNLVASAASSAFRLGVDRGDRWLCCLPMYHMGGLAPVIRSTLYGSTLVVQRSFDPESTAGVLEEYGITGVSLVPTMLKRLLDDGWRPPESLRFVLLGGAPASRELLDRCADRDVPVHPTYGMTETASQIATATPAEAFAHEGTVGQPLMFTEVVVLRDDGSVADLGESGELVVSGPTVTPGYLDDDRTQEAFDDRGLHTGDVGYRDEDGRLWIHNRRADRIVTGGENVDPGEVIAVLRSYPAVEDAAVVGLPDEEWGERVAALVVPADRDAPPSIDSLLDRCAGRLAGFKRPKTIGFVDDLPRTHSGTVDREAARDRLRSIGEDVGDR